LRFENARIWASSAHIADLRVPATRDTNQFAKDAAERAPDDIARFVRREIERARGAKLKSKPVEFERQRGQHSIVLDVKLASLSVLVRSKSGSWRGG